MALPHQGREDGTEALIGGRSKGPAQGVARGDHSERPAQPGVQHGPADCGGERTAQINFDSGLREDEDGVGVCTPRRVHGNYMFATIASANSLVRSRVAPSIWRWKS